MKSPPYREELQDGKFNYLSMTYSMSSQKAIKGSAIADFLAERVSEDSEPINFDFLDKHLMAISHDEKESSKKTDWKLYFDWGI